MAALSCARVLTLRVHCRILCTKTGPPTRSKRRPTLPPSSSPMMHGSHTTIGRLPPIPPTPLWRLSLSPITIPWARHCTQTHVLQRTAMCAETHARSAPPLLALLTSCARLADAFLVRCGSCDALFSFLSMARPGMARPRMARPRMARMACQGMASDGKVPSCGSGRCLSRSAGVSARRQRDRRAPVSSRSHVHLHVMGTRQSCLHMPGETRMV